MDSFPIAHCLASRSSYIQILAYIKEFNQEQCSNSNSVSHMHGDTHMEPLKEEK